MSTYYKNVISGVRNEYYAFFSGATTAILEDDTQYKLIPNTRTESEVQGFAVSITESQYNTFVDNLEFFARVGSHPPHKP